jgi:hypothetical protein
MKTQTLGWIVGLGAAACSFMSCSQAQVQCQVGSAAAFPYAVMYTPVGTVPACAAGILKKSELIGMEFYHPITTVNGDVTYDQNTTSVAIQSNYMGTLKQTYAGVGAADPNMSHTVYALGNFPKPPVPDANDMCAITGLTTAQQDFPAVTDTMGAGNLGMPCNATSTNAGSCAADAGACTTANDCCSGSCTSGKCDAGMDNACAMMGNTAAGVVCDPTQNKCVLGCRGMGGNTCDATFACSSTDGTIGQCSLPADSVSYQWSNVEAYVTASAQGTQVSATLTYTETVAGAPCTVTYKAIGLWPGIGCIDPTSGMPNDDLCNPCAEPTIGRATGSGINPNFPTHCDPDLGYCVLGNTAGFKTDAGLAAKGQLKVDSFTPATSIPQILNDGDPNIVVCP